MSAANQLPAAMTLAEFLAWNPQGSDRWELIDGTLRAMAPATPRHGAIQSEVNRLIGNHLAELRPPCRVITEPGIQPKVRGNLNVRVPDLAVTCAAWDPDDRLLHEGSHCRVPRSGSLGGGGLRIVKTTATRSSEIPLPRLAATGGSEWRIPRQVGSCQLEPLGALVAIRRARDLDQIVGQEGCNMGTRP
jgi:hypothetical protein